MMNILIIGNGFDLAHGLPTKYTDFLEFCRMIKDIYICREIKKENLEALWNDLYLRVSSGEKRLKQLFYELNTIKEKRRTKDGNFSLNQYMLTNTKYDELFSCIINNIWIEYFRQNTMYQKENWIDFENEISKLIQSIDVDIPGKDFESKLRTERLVEIYLKGGFISYESLLKEKGIGQKDIKITYKKFRDILYADLKELTRALEIYLCEYVGKIEISKKSPDIESLKINRVLSFNYTDTFSKLYRIAEKIEEKDTNPFDYIHGKANINHEIESNNMVLGIDEYLPDDRKNRDIGFIAFKKYYQRIYKGTGCQYRGWVDEILEDRSVVANKLGNEFSSHIPFSKCIGKHHFLYIFGHSLDITDKDILRELILNDNVKTTIFYPDRKELERKIINLVKIIGQDELIRRTGGSTKTIEFKLQQDMVPIENSSL